MIETDLNRFYHSIDKSRHRHVTLALHPAPGRPFLPTSGTAALGLLPIPIIPSEEHHEKRP